MAALHPNVLEFVAALGHVGYDLVIKPSAQCILVRGELNRPCGCHAKVHRRVEFAAIQVGNLGDAEALAWTTSQSILDELEDLSKELDAIHAQDESKAATHPHGVN
jgi:hypothetical protein